ncbi:MAG: hypothetical protein AVDCRST_MAG13-3979, partial [uncultured Solirubrobacteraceae bacterium]
VRARRPGRGVRGRRARGGDLRREPARHDRLPVRQGVRARRPGRRPGGVGAARGLRGALPLAPRPDARARGGLHGRGGRERAPPRRRGLRGDGGGVRRRPAPRGRVRGARPRAHAGRRVRPPRL